MYCSNRKPGSKVHASGDTKLGTACFSHQMANSAGVYHPAEIWKPKEASRRTHAA